MIADNRDYNPQEWVQLIKNKCGNMWTYVNEHIFG